MYNPIITSFVFGIVCVILSEVYYKIKNNDNENIDPSIKDNKVNNQLIIFIGLFTICYIYLVSCNHTCVDNNNNIDVESAQVDDILMENIDPTKVPF